MKQLFKDHIKDHIQIAVGIENGEWYVQTSDTGADTYYSESIDEGLATKDEALAIANHYAKYYDLEVVVWDEVDNKELFVYSYCDQWKTKDSMRLAGVYTSFTSLKRRILDDYKDRVIELNGIDEIDMYNINEISYGHIDFVNPNEAL